VVPEDVLGSEFGGLRAEQGQRVQSEVVERTSVIDSQSMEDNVETVVSDLMSLILDDVAQAEVRTLSSCLCLRELCVMPLSFSLAAKPAIFAAFLVQPFFSTYFCVYTAARLRFVRLACAEREFCILVRISPTSKRLRVPCCRQMEWMFPLWRVQVGSRTMTSPMTGPAPFASTAWPRLIWQL
jgi:hypothetical protein